MIIGHVHRELKHACKRWGRGLGAPAEGVPASRKKTTREMANATHLFRMSLSLGRPYPGQNDHAGADGDEGGRACI